MHVLALDVGSYSVKYVSSFVDKRKITLVDMSELVIRDYLTDHPEMTHQEAQISIVQEIIDSTARPDTKIIFNAENEILTTRFLTLPTKSKKTADRMLPFNLEEDIPYALSEVHFAYRLEKQKTQHMAIVELARADVFENYFNLLRDKNALPHLLTSEASVMENFFNQNAIAGPFCVLDIGHKTTKAYFFYNSRLLITHISYVGGHHVNEMIAESYKIDVDEAIFYKHQNAFLLTSNQYNDVEPAQRDFASAMEKVFAPLITDFTRWKIGMKVNYGLSVGHIFICGGTSNIKNITNFLTEKWDIKVALLECFDKADAEKVDVNPKNKSKFALAAMEAQGFRRKNRFVNLLTGRFAQSGLAELPLHSFAFIGARVAGATLILAISLMAERFFIQRDIAFVNGRIQGLIKNTELQIPNRVRRSILTNPKPVYDALVKRQRGVRQEISTLQSAIEIKALSPLVTVSQIAAATDATMLEFKATDGGEITAKFTSENPEDLKKLQGAFQRSVLTDVKVTINNKELLMKAAGL